MTKVVRLEHTTRQRLRWWSVAALGCVVASSALAIAAGGESAWVRMALGAIAAERCVAAVRHRSPLGPSVVAAVAALLMVPVDARLDRTLVSALGAVLIVVGAECAQVARRLVTVVPVTEMQRDRNHVVGLAAWAAVGVGVTVAVAQVDAWASRTFVVGAVLAGAGFVWLVTTRPSTR